METGLLFTGEEMVIDNGLGYPKAYSKLCRDRSFGPFAYGPPFTFTPYQLPQHEIQRAKELDEMFPIIDPTLKSTAKAKIFVGLLWKQLNHLGNAGFDPAIFRVDPYGNVLYYHADSASALAWDIDHWFPCSRGGLTVPSNLRIMQWQVCKNKHSKLEFLIPWWELQAGISVNQFLAIFASSNSDFRNRAFSLLFSDGENEELNVSQSVSSHNFPQPFVQSKEKVGLAPAAIVMTQREPFESSLALKSLDYNRRPRSNTPIVAARISKLGVLKENKDPDSVSNPYHAIVVARDSLRHKEETGKLQAELQKLDDEVDEWKQKTEEERLIIQDLELVLIKRRRRAEKCRRLAEAQSSYRAMLEKMIRDAMHQSVVYKEQVRLNQAATNALMARLEAQKAICDSAETELHRKFKQRDDLEKELRPEWEQARKRSRRDDFMFEDNSDKTVLYLPRGKPRTYLLQKDMAETLKDNEDRTILYLPDSGNHLHKELRDFLDEEQKASEAGMSLQEEQGQEQAEDMRKEKGGMLEECKAKDCSGDENPIEYMFQGLRIGERGEPEIEEDEETRRERGKGNVEKWLQMLLDSSSTQGDTSRNPGSQESTCKNDELMEIKVKEFQEKDNEQREEKIAKTEAGNTYFNQQVAKETNPKKKVEFVEQEPTKTLLNKQQTVLDDGSRTEEFSEMEARNTLRKSPPCHFSHKRSDASEVDWVGKGVGGSTSFEGKRRDSSGGKGKGLVRSESARALRHIPSSPSILLKKSVDCIMRPLVIGDDDGNDKDQAAGNNFIKTVKKAVKI